MGKTLLFVIFILHFGGCATTSRPKADLQGSGPGSIASSSPDQLTEGEGAEDEVADSEGADRERDDEGDSVSEATDNPEAIPFEPDVLEEGFCKDDIYAQYLRDQYLHHRPKLAQPKTYRRARDRERQVDMDALFFARSRLLGTMAPYFGALPVVANPQVEYWIRFFKTSGHQSFLRWLVRAQSVRDVVDPLLHQEGLPPELFFLAMVESGFSNSAYSRARATGPWQFMKGTARLYGLNMGHWVDERRDPVKSTLAAARYLRDLYQDFGDWYLAMAAYNAGPGKIRRAIRGAHSRDFWDIAATKHIRSETKHYVPKVLAALILASNPRANGFEVVPDPADATPKTTVKVLRPIRLSDLANELAVPASAIAKWNPELIRGITPPRRDEQGYDLRLPATLVEKYAQVEPKLAVLEIKDVLMHRVQPGDTLSRIASRYRVGVHQILSINPTLTTKNLRIGREIAVPVPGIATVKKRPNQA